MNKRLATEFTGGARKRKYHPQKEHEVAEKIHKVEFPEGLSWIEQIELVLKVLSPSDIRFLKSNFTLRNYYFPKPHITINDVGAYLHRSKK